MYKLTPPVAFSVGGAGRAPVICAHLCDRPINRRLYFPVSVVRLVRSQFCPINVVPPPLPADGANRQFCSNAQMFAAAADADAALRSVLIYQHRLLQMAPIGLFSIKYCPDIVSTLSRSVSFFLDALLCRLPRLQKQKQNNMMAFWGSDRRPFSKNKMP